MLHISVPVSEPTTAIRRAGLNDQVYETLREWVINRRLGPGDKVSLHELAELLGVSRSPVHHGLTRLVAEGLLTVRPRRGYFVNPLTPKVVEDAYDVRLGLELVAAERTVGRLSGEQLAELRRRMEMTLPVPGDDPASMEPSVWHRTNRQFHEYQIDLAENALLSEMYRRLSVNLLMEWALAGRAASWLPTVNEEHVELVEAFESGRLALVELALRKHNKTGRVIAAEALAAAGGIA